MLTIIAGALLYLCALMSGPALLAKNVPVAVGPNMLAETKPQPVVIVGWGTVRDDGQIFLSTLKDRGGMVRTEAAFPVAVREMPAQPVPVRVEAMPQQPVPVSINSIKKGPYWEPIRTLEEPAPTQARPGDGVIPR
jgi:hypothetical protein